MLTHVGPQLEKEVAEIEFKKQYAPKHDSSEALKRELDRLNLLFQKGRITEAYYEEQYSELENKLSQYNQEDRCVSLESYKGLIKAFSGNWQELYHKLDKAHKQAFWKSTIKDIQIDKETHQIKGFNFLTNLE